MTNKSTSDATIGRTDQPTLELLGLDERDHGYPNGVDYFDLARVQTTATCSLKLMVRSLITHMVTVAAPIARSIPVVTTLKILEAIPATTDQTLQ